MGPQGLLAHLRGRYWPLSGRQIIRRVLRKCIACFRVRPSEKSQLIGDLPRARVTPYRAFINSGVDYAGPFYKIVAKQNRKGLFVYFCMLFN